MIDGYYTAYNYIYLSRFSDFSFCVSFLLWGLLIGGLIMANICYTCLEDITGSLLDDIEAGDEALLKVFPWFREGNAYGLVYAGENSLEFSSKWDFPVRAFLSLLKLYPTLSLSGHSSEVSAEVFWGLLVKDGVLEVTSLRPVPYYCMYDDAFRSLHRGITEAPYKQFLSLAMKDMDDVIESEALYYLESLVLKRIKDRDLPLFLHKEWLYESDNFIARLKGV